MQEIVHLIPDWFATAMVVGSVVTIFFLILATSISDWLETRKSTPKE